MAIERTVTVALVSDTHGYICPQVLSMVGKCDYVVHAGDICGKHILDDLHARFRNHTLGLFEKHGMTNLMYWTPQDEALSHNTLVYVLAHPSREAADASWRAFGSDPEWRAAFEASRSDGPLVASVERMFLDLTDYSPMR